MDNSTIVIYFKHGRSGTAKMYNWLTDNAGKRYTGWDWLWEVAPYPLRIIGIKLYNQDPELAVIFKLKFI